MHTRSSRISCVLLLVVAVATSIAVVTPGCTGEAEAAEVAVRFEVDGMTCENCVAAISSAVGEVDGVLACEVSLEEKAARVRITDESVAATVAEEIAALGFKVRRLQ